MASKELMGTKAREGTWVFVEIVFVGLPIDRDEVEEALEAAFELDGEVTGAGSGIAGHGIGRCHLDLEIDRNPFGSSRSRPSSLR